MRDHPEVKLPKSKWVTLLNTLILFMLIGTVVYTIISYSSLPDRVPIHFNLKGEADGWGGKGSIFMLPLIILPSCLILYVLSKMPHLHNYYKIKVTEENAPKLYSLSRFFLTFLNFQTVLMTSYLSWSIVQSAQEIETFGSWVWVVLIAAPLVTVVYFIIKMNQIKKEHLND